MPGGLSPAATYDATSTWSATDVRVAWRGHERDHAAHGQSGRRRSSRQGGRRGRQEAGVRRGIELETGQDLAYLRGLVQGRPDWSSIAFAAQMVEGHTYAERGQVREHRRHRRTSRSRDRASSSAPGWALKPRYTMKAWHRRPRFSGRARGAEVDREADAEGWRGCCRGCRPPRRETTGRGSRPDTDDRRPPKPKKDFVVGIDRAGAVAAVRTPTCSAGRPGVRRAPVARAPGMRSRGRAVARKPVNPLVPAGARRPLAAPRFSGDL